MPKGKIDSLLGRSLKSTHHKASSNTLNLPKENIKPTRGTEGNKNSSSIHRKVSFLSEQGKEINDVEAFTVEEEGTPFSEASLEKVDFGTFSTSIKATNLNYNFCDPPQQSNIAYRGCEFKDIDAEIEIEQDSWHFKNSKQKNLKNTYYQSLEIAPPSVTIAIKKQRPLQPYKMNSNLLSEVEEVDDDYSLNQYEHDKIINTTNQNKHYYEGNQRSNYLSRLYHLIFCRDCFSKENKADDYEQIVDIEDSDNIPQLIEAKTSSLHQPSCKSCFKTFFCFHKLCFYSVSTCVLTGIFILCVSFERVCFKATIDQMEPFRVFSAVFMSIINTGLLYIIFKLKRSKIVNIIDMEATMESKNGNDTNISFPRFDIFVIAMLDSIQLYLITITAGNTPPVLTILLMQATKPMNYLLRTLGCNIFNSNNRSSSEKRNLKSSQLQHHSNLITPNSRYNNFPKGDQRYETSAKKRTFSEYLINNGQFFGSSLISLGIFASLAVSLYASLRSEELLAVVNISAYFLLCLFSCISSLYKERAILRYEYTVSNFYISYLTGKYQVIIMLLLSPIAYSLQGLGREDFTIYYKIKYLSALRDSFVCFSSINFNNNVNINTEFTIPTYPEDSPCNYALPSTLLYSLCLSFTPLLLELVLASINIEKATFAEERRETENILAHENYMSSNSMLHNSSRYKSTGNLSNSHTSLNNLSSIVDTRSSSQKAISISSPPSASALLEFNVTDGDKDKSINYKKIDANCHLSPKEMHESHIYIYKCMLCGFVLATGILSFYSYYRAEDIGWLDSIQLNIGDAVGFVLIAIGFGTSWM